MKLCLSACRDLRRRNRLGAGRIVLRSQDQDAASASRPIWRMYRGKVSLVVNVASKCGFTPQYEGPREAAARDEGQGLQRPRLSEQRLRRPGARHAPRRSRTFCKLTYDVTFPMFEKVVTKAGADQSPIYSFLGTSGNLPAWNFSKYVIGKDGTHRRVLPERGDAGRSGAARGDREGARELDEVSTSKYESVPRGRSGWCLFNRSCRALGSGSAAGHIA